MSELILFIALYYHTPNFAGNGIYLNRMSKKTRDAGKFRHAQRNKKTTFSLCAWASLRDIFRGIRFPRTIEKTTGGKSWL